MDAETFFLAIERHGNTYQGRLHRGDPAQAVVLPDLALGPNAEVEIDGKPHRLGSMIDRLTAFDTDFLRAVLDSRGLLCLGAHLYRQTFGRLESASLRSLPTEADIRLRIVVDEADEDVAWLPWVLLARDGLFLCANGWSVGLCHHQGQGRDCELPPSPRMLVAMPEPEGYNDTQAREHLDELEEHLSREDARLVRGEHLHVARTWDELRALAAEVRPAVVYYYGHGEGDRRSSKLIFESANGKRQRIEAADFAQALRRNGPEAPLLAYVNCCQGDAGGVLGVGWQLGTFIPAVLTNRTKALVTAARKQAMAFWDATLLKGQAPHAAVSGLYSQVGDMGLSLGDVRWMTPVFHGFYNNWRANPPQPPDRTIADPHWDVKLDRKPQFGVLSLEARDMIRFRRPVCLTYVWYGREGYGLDAFHKRIRFELGDHLDDTILHPVMPTWPDELADPHRSFTDMVTKAFEISSLDALPGRLRTLKHGETRRRLLVFVRHNTFRGSAPISPKILRSYLEWWSYTVTPKLHDAGGFALLGLSFMVKDPEKFHRVMQKTIGESEVKNVSLLDELEPLRQKDIEDFLATYAIHLPARRQERELERILAETQGLYWPIVAALQDLQSRAYQSTTVKTEETSSDDDDFGLG